MLRFAFRSCVRLSHFPIILSFLLVFAISQNKDNNINYHKTLRLNYVHLENYCVAAPVNRRECRP